MNWLDEIVKQHEEYESPLTFYYWGALSAISAVLKDSVYLDRGKLYKLYPNIYVMLHADSGLRKGPPISMAKQLVDPLNVTRTIVGRGSIQGILKEMGTGKTEPGGKIMGTSSAFICSSELTSSIVDDPVAVKILTDLYDRNYNIGNWRQLLKSDNFNLKDPTLTMLTATNEAMSEDFFTRAAIKGGYVARTFIIHENKRNRINSLLIPPKNPPDLANARNYLAKLAKLKGAIEPLGSREQSDVYRFPIKDTDSGELLYYNKQGVIYEEWYHRFTNQVDESDLKDETGTLNRFGDSVLKVAILLSLAKEPVLRITEECMDEAIRKCEAFIGSVRKVTLGKQGYSKDAALKTAIVKELLQRDNHQISRQMLMSKMWMHYSTTQEIDDIMLGFDNADLIKTRSIGNQIIFLIEPTRLEEVKLFLEGKKHRL
jgi:hypothetical protein